MKKYLMWLAPILVLLILATAFYPAYNPKPKDISIAILNEDKGVDVQDNTKNVGKTFVEKLKENKNETIDWKEVSSKAELEKGLDDNEYVGAITIESDFSKNAVSQAQHVIMTEKQKEIKEQIESGALSPQQQQALLNNGTPNIPEVKQANVAVTIHQGSNGQIATIAQQALNKVTDQMNDQISQQNAKALAQNNVNLPSDQYEAFANPVKVNETIINEIKDNQGNGNGASAMFMPIWLTSLITSMIAFTIFNNRGTLRSQNEKLKFTITTVGSLMIASLIGAFLYIYYMGHVLGFDFNQSIETVIYIAIAVMGFSFLILGCLVWLGLPAVPLLMLFVFFSIQASILPVQMLPEFYQDYILPWNPFYHYIATLKELLYEGVNLTLNGTVWMFILFITFGVVSFTTVVYIKKFKADMTAKMI